MDRCLTVCGLLFDCSFNFSSQPVYISLENTILIIFGNSMIFAIISHFPFVEVNFFDYNWFIREPRSQF